jgi:hypothetical protein
VSIKRLVGLRTTGKSPVAALSSAPPPDPVGRYKAEVPADVIELTWQRLMAGGEGNHQGLVAEGPSGGGGDGGGDFVGIAHLLLHRSTWSPTHYCYLEDLYVDQGVSRSRAPGRLSNCDTQKRYTVGAHRGVWPRQRSRPLRPRA